MVNDDVKYCTVPLPDDIAREIAVGHEKRAEKLIAMRLVDETLPQTVKKRLEWERKIIEERKHFFTVSKLHGYIRMKRRVTDFTRREWKRLFTENKIEWIYRNGRVRIGYNFHHTLFKVYPQIANRLTEKQQYGYDRIDGLLADWRDGEERGCRLQIRQSLLIADSAIDEGRILKVHVPMAVERNGIRNLKLLQTSYVPVQLPGKEDSNPTVYFEIPAEKGMKVRVEYSLDFFCRYTDTSRIRPETTYGTIPEPEREFLCECLPEIGFTPFMHLLRDEIVGTETCPLLIARKIYDYVTCQIQYRFIGGYIPNRSEYCAANGRGDCVNMSLLFVTLLRLSGIPAMIESGIDAKPEWTEEHTWALFYLPSVGWLHADLSAGALAYGCGAFDRWNFYFGNIDPYRIPINRDWQKALIPPKRFLRSDPFDSQFGEAEYDNRGLTAKEMECFFWCEKAERIV